MSGNECDVYAHFWWDESYKGKVNRLHVAERFDMDRDPIEDFKRLYAPKKIVHERCVNVNTNGCSLDWGDNDVSTYRRVMNSFTWYSIYSRHNSMKRSLDIIENPDEYDLIVVLRSDLLTFRTGTLSNELPTIAPSKLYMPSTLHGGPMFAGEHPNRIGDWFFMGKYDWVRRFTDTCVDHVAHKSYMPAHNQERLLFLANLANVSIDLFGSSISVRRFIREEWEDKSYYDQHHLDTSLYVELFDTSQGRMKDSELLPFYTHCIGF